MTLRPERQRARDVVLRVRRRDREAVAELVERDLLAHGIGEFDANLVAGEGPLDLHAAETLHELLLEVDQLGLFVAEIETVAEAEPRDAVLAVERWQGHLITERQLREHDRGVDIVRPVEDAGTVRERQRVAGNGRTGADQRDLQVQAGLAVAVEKQSLLLAVRLVEDHEAAGGPGRLGLRRSGRHLHRLGETRPLAEIARGVEVRHPRRMMRVRRALVITEIEEAMFLVEIGLVEEHEQPPENVVVFDLLIIGDPAVAQALQDQTDQVHLAIGASGASEGPAKSVVADQIRSHLDVLLGVGAQGRQLPIAHAAVRVQLQRRADEHERHHPVQIEVAAETGRRVVEESRRARLVDPVDHALDEPRGFVLLREPETETGHRLGDIERLPVIIVIAAVQE